MKVLFLTLSSISKFPAAKRALGMGSELVLMGHDVYIALEDCKENRERFANEAQGCNAIWIPSRTLLAEVYYKLKAVRQIKPDVLYSLSYSPRNLAFMSCFIPRTTKYLLEYSELYSSFKPIWKYREFISLFEVDGLICASRYLKSIFHARERRIHKEIPLLYLPYAYPRYIGKAKVDNPQKRPQRIIFMAALWKNYGVYLVIEAFLVMAKVVHSAELVIIGKGPEYENIKKMTAEADVSHCIHLAGFVPESDLDSFFSTADAFIAPMKSTVQDIARCPSKLFYYLPYQKPIITCRIGNPYDILGEWGFYYEPDNVNDMAVAMANALLASDKFTYPPNFISHHTWASRAREFIKWINKV